MVKWAVQHISTPPQQKSLLFWISHAHFKKKKVKRRGSHDRAGVSQSTVARNQTLFVCSRFSSGFSLPVAVAKQLAFFLTLTTVPVWRRDGHYRAGGDRPMGWASEDVPVHLFCVAQWHFWPPIFENAHSWCRNVPVNYPSKHEVDSTVAAKHKKTWNAPI